eukprot:CAMPEP_0177637638 /NCGR_PEP_ID=MMETSP0447-20121125/5073_1 /TAXON_ID=0 /ORGANISM="Stygamoeba regulata, Strain BSH-02190019" /LENGTH=1331 /DNA_ID=CAMNT_0019139569 /DNA_START=180 /DNA_END=4171 /DNA_ORIENTATION=-
MSESEAQKTNLNAGLSKKKGGDAEGKRAKPLKIGFLYVVEGKLKKQFKFRFCMLTTSNELEWYRKQEDQVDHKRAGYIKNLDQCQIDEAEDQYGLEFCFKVVISGKVHYFAGSNDQDRMNWMVEILKLRGLKYVIDLLSSTNLARHAAFAFANLAGAKIEESHDINKVGGLGPIFKFLETDTAQKEERIQEITYYAFTKLCEKEGNANKIEIGKFYTNLYAVLQNNPIDKFRELAMQSILKASTIDENKKRIRDMDGFTPLVDVLLKEGSSEKLQEVCANVIFSCVENDQNKLEVINRYLNVLKEALPKCKNGAQEYILRTITLCSQNDAMMKSINSCDLAPTLIPLLAGQRPEVHLAAVHLLSLLASNDVASHKNKLDILNKQGFENLMTLLECKDEKTIGHTLHTLLVCSQHDDCSLGIAKLHGALLPLINRLSSEQQSFRSDALAILFNISSKPASLTAISSHRATMKALLEGVKNSTHTESYEAAFAEQSFHALANLTTVDSIKVDMCKHAILEHMLKWLATTNELFLVQLLRTISNCSTHLAAKVKVGEMGLLSHLVLLMEAKHDVIPHQAAIALANCATVEKNSQDIAVAGLIPRIVKLLASRNEDLQEHTARCLRNLALLDANETKVSQSGGIKELCALLGSRKLGVASSALAALRNLVHANPCKQEAVKQDVLGAAVGTLKKQQSTEQMQEDAAVIFECLLSHGAKASPQVTEALVKMLQSNNTVLLSRALPALLAAVKNDDCQKQVLQAGQAELLKLVKSDCHFAKQHAAKILEACLKNAAVQELFHSQASINSLFTVLPCDNVSVLESLTSIINHLSRNESFTELLRPKMGSLACLLRFPHSRVKRNAGEAMITCCQKGGEIPVVHPTSSRGISALLEGASKIRLGSDSKLKIDDICVNLSIGSAAIEFEKKDELNAHLARSVAHLYYGCQAIVSYSVDNFCSQNEESVAQSIRKSVKLTSSVELTGMPDLPSSNQDTPISFRLPQMESIGHCYSMLDAFSQQHVSSILCFLRQLFRKRADPKELLTNPPQNSLVADCGKAAKVDVAKSVATYGNDDLGIASLVRAANPLESHGSIAYFEVFVVSQGRTGSIGVGLGGEGAPGESQPGWGEGSYGYHGDDGNKFSHGENEVFGPRFGTGDIIGCGHDTVKDEIFFTKNGQFIGVAFHSVSGPLFPMVGLGSPCESVFVNFGQLPFVWDFNALNTLQFTAAPKATYSTSAPAPYLPDRCPILAELFLWNATNYTFLDREVAAVMEQFQAAVKATEPATRAALQRQPQQQIQQQIPGRPAKVPTAGIAAPQGGLGAQASQPVERFRQYLQHPT